MVKYFFGVLLYVTFMVSFIFGTAILMSAGLWYVGIPVFILGLTCIIVGMKIAIER